MYIKKILLLSLLCFPLTLCADINIDDLKLFKQAESAIQKSTYPKLKSKLDGFFMRPYLDYQYLVYHFKQTDNKQIDHYLKEHKNTPYAALLKRRWIDYLARKARWSDYLKYGSFNTSSTRRQCDYLTALYQTKQKTAAYAKVAQIWTVGKSQPNSCDFIFKKWIDSKHLTPTLVWKRIDSAMFKRNIGLAKYLKRYLDKSEQKIVDRWLAIYNKPQKALKLDDLNLRPSRKHKIMISAVKRQYYQKHKKAIILWQTLQKNEKFSKAEIGALDSWLVRRLYDEDSDFYWQYISQSQPHDDKGKGAKIRAALLREDWNKVLDWVETLSSTEKDEEVWRYWEARALMALGKKHQGQYILGNLAHERSFYGFLAADQLGEPYRFNHQPTPDNKILQNHLAKQAGFKRATFFIQLNRAVEARREWRYAIKDLNLAELHAATQLASQLDWDFQVILTLAKAKSWNDVEKRFPLAFLEQVKKQAKNNKIDFAWVYGIIRQESAFNYRANSAVGATGLMQLMPATAKRVAKMLGIKKYHKKDLNNPLTNIQFGTKYLAHAYQKLRNNPVLATAGYNAGPHRVRKWLKQRPNMEADRWIELIPFRETRKYVKRVLTYATIYDHFRLKTKNQSLSQRLVFVENEIHLAKAEM